MRQLYSLDTTIAFKLLSVLRSEVPDRSGTSLSLRKERSNFIIQESMKETFHSHTINIGEESFDIENNNRRLYKFLDWKSARESLIRIIKSKLAESHNIDDAYIEFKMANPMRRSRLGNFYINIQATVSYEGKSYGTLEELGLSPILVDDYVTHDEEELTLREDVENRFSSEQYNKEYALRVRSLAEILKKTDNSLEFREDSDVKELVFELMSLEGWSTKKDNRIHSRIRRLPKEINLND